MTPRASWVAAVLLWSAGEVAAAPPDPAPLPDAEFLEFLGSWHTGDDRWIDPVHAVEMTGMERRAQQPGTSPADSAQPSRPKQGGTGERGARTQDRPSEPSREMKP